MPEPEKKKVPWNSAEFVFSARLVRVERGPVARSFPPVYSNRLHLQVRSVLRGDLEIGADVEALHTARQHEPPSYPEGQMCLVAASQSRDRLRVDRIEAASDQQLKAAELQCQLPLGWAVRNGSVLSPWVDKGQAAWTAEMDGDAAVHCSQTGRPALLAGPAVSFDVTAVPPAEEIKWTNPDGDGLYEVTVTNRTDQPVDVPALLSSGDQILWAESLVILCQDRAYACPGSQGVSGKVTPTRLQPGQSVGTVVNALRLDGPEWPRGGYRIEFQFCLGEKSQTESFYYMSRHHDKIREKAASQ
jgi:hypothetical protein